MEKHEKHFYKAAGHPVPQQDTQVFPFRQAHGQPPGTNLDGSTSSVRAEPMDTTRLKKPIPIPHLEAPRSIKARLKQKPTPRIA